MTRGPSAADWYSEEASRTGQGPGRQAALDELRGAQAGAPLRVFLGRDRQGRATLALHDGEQRPRLRMSVALDGTATLEFLDQDGEVVRALP